MLSKRERKLIEAKAFPWGPYVSKDIVKRNKCEVVIIGWPFEDISVRNPGELNLDQRQILVEALDAGTLKVRDKHDQNMGNTSLHTDHNRVLICT